MGIIKQGGGRVAQVGENQAHLNPPHTRRGATGLGNPEMMRSTQKNKSKEEKVFAPTKHYLCLIGRDSQNGT